MAQFPRTVGLAEAYRFIVRAGHPERPELADEITSADWFVWPTTKSPEEIQATKNARKLLEDGIAKERIRLRGVLNPSLPPQDIDPAEARNGKPDVFGGQLAVSRRRYVEVACYEIDLRRAVKCREAKPNGMTNRKPLSEAELAIFVKNHLANGGLPTEGRLEKPWKTPVNTHSANACVLYCVLHFRIGGRAVRKQKIRQKKSPENEARRIANFDFCCWHAKMVLRIIFCRHIVDGINAFKTR